MAKLSIQYWFEQIFSVRFYAITYSLVQLEAKIEMNRPLPALKVTSDTNDRVKSTLLFGSSVWIRRNQSSASSVMSHLQ